MLIRCAVPDSPHYRNHNHLLFIKKIKTMMTAVSFVLLGSFAILIGKMFSRLLQFSPLKVAKPLGQEAHLYVVR